MQRSENRGKEYASLQPRRNQWRMPMTTYHRVLPNLGLCDLIARRIGWHVLVECCGRDNLAHVPNATPERS